MGSPARRSRRGPAGRDPPGIWRRLLVGLAVSLAFILLELRQGGAYPWYALELQTLDWRFRVRGPIPPGPETVLVMIDDRTVAEFGAWPLPRAAVAAAVRRIADAGAAVIALDLMFTEAERPVRPEIAALLNAAATALPADRADLRRRLEAALGAGGDLELTLAILKAGRVVTPYAFVFDPAAGNMGGVPPWVSATAYRVRTGAAADTDGADLTPSGLLVPAPGLASAGVSAGHVTLVLEPDGSLRAALPAIPYHGELYPSMPVEAVRRFLGLGREGLAAAPGHAVLIGPLRLPLDPAGRQLVNHYGPRGTIPTVSVADLLRGRADPERLAGRIVVLGAAAVGAGDSFATPFSARLPGAEFLATAIDNILHGRSLRRDDATRSIDLAAIGCLALGTALLAGRRSPLFSLLVCLVAVAAWAGTAQLAFTRWDLWLAGAAPAAAALAAGVGVELLRLIEERRRRQALERQRANLGRYFPPTVVERLAAGDPAAALEGTREATVMFVDIVGFTRLAEAMAPDAAMALLRAFHGEVERAVFAHGGMVDKFMGDGAMACFGIPDPAPAAAAGALRAAFDLLAALERPLPGSSTRLRVAVGIHHGPVLMGDLGGAKQVQFTVVGDAVNVASRLEALTRVASTQLIISEAALAIARPHLEPALLTRLAPMPEQHLRGRAAPIALWRLPETPASG